MQQVGGELALPERTSHATRAGTSGPQPALEYLRGSDTKLEWLCRRLQYSELQHTHLPYGAVSPPMSAAKTTGAVRSMPHASHAVARSALLMRRDSAGCIAGVACLEH